MKQLPAELIEVILLKAAQLEHDDPRESLAYLAVLRPTEQLRRAVIPTLPWCSMDELSTHGCVRGLQWWAESGLPLEYTDATMDGAAGGGHIDVLQWWKDSGLKIKYSESALDAASVNDHFEVFKWWQSSRLQFFFELAPTSALRNGNVQILKLLHRMAELYIDPIDIVAATSYKQREARAWCLANLVDEDMVHQSEYHRYGDSDEDLNWSSEEHDIDDCLGYNCSVHGDGDY
ncbi:hypothetical protein H9P43_004495 [Blastocladiella emersonii ATCC 22665]|nr:hypothetical protein H9P43_004495 [Blastocladiella emersonii ATCC 22665]